jgi:hypothetical protein
MMSIAPYGFIAGGFVRHLLVTGAAKPSDIDIFLRKPEDYEFMYNVILAEGYRKNSESPAAVEFYHPYEKDYIHPQLVKPQGQTGHRGRTGTPQEVLSTFDFTTNQFALTTDDEGYWRAITGWRAYEDTNSKRLILVNPFNPMALVYRIIKYAAKGYWMPRTEAARLFMAWDQTSPKLKNWVIEQFKLDPEDQDMELLYMLTDGLIGEEALD